MSDDRTALMYAVINGNTELGKLLIDGKADMNAKDKGGMTALIEAFRNGKESFGKLIDGKADLHAKDEDDTTALMYAAINGNTELGKLLIYSKANMNAKDKGDKTALIHAAINGNTEFGKLLIDGKADMNAKDKDGMTAFMQACRNGKESFGKLLIDGKADLHAKDELPPPQGNKHVQHSPLDKNNNLSDAHIPSLNLNFTIRGNPMSIGWSLRSSILPFSRCTQTEQSVGSVQSDQLWAHWAIQNARVPERGHLRQIPHHLN